MFHHSLVLLLKIAHKLHRKINTRCTLTQEKVKYNSGVKEHPEGTVSWKLRLNSGKKEN